MFERGMDEAVMDVCYNVLNMIETVKVMRLVERKVDSGPELVDEEALKTGKSWILLLLLVLSSEETDCMIGGNCKRISGASVA